MQPERRRDRRRRHRRADARALPAPRRHRLPRLRAGGGDPAARRRHQHPAARHRRAARARRARSAGAGGGDDARGGVLQPLRPARLHRARGTLRRLRDAAALDPSRRPAGRAARRRCRRASAADAVVTGHACVGVDADGARRGAPAPFAIPQARRCPRSRRRSRSAATASTRRFAASCIPHEGPPRWSGVNMWRGVTAARAVPERRDHGPRRLARRSARW